MLSEGVKYIFSCSSAVHRIQATQLFMHLTVTTIPSDNRLTRIIVYIYAFIKSYAENIQFLTQLFAAYLRL